LDRGIDITSFFFFERTKTVVGQYMLSQKAYDPKREIDKGICEDVLKFCTSIQKYICGLKGD
jgi:hypothetical protein